MRFFAMGPRLHAFLAHDIMNDLALEGVHRLQIHRLSGLTRLIDGVQGEVVQTLALALQEAVDVHDEVGAFAGFLLHSKAGQLLQRVDHFPIASD